MSRSKSQAVLTSARTNAIPGRWKLEDAKARLSEVVRLAATSGPQLITVRGKEAAVIVAPHEYQRLSPNTEGRLPLMEFLQGLAWDGLDEQRERDTGRETEL